MKMKKGISLITLMVTIVVLMILAGIIILTLNNTGLMKDSKEAKYKSELKSFDEEIREKISREYLEDKTIINKVIRDREEIKKYSESLVKSEYIEYAYISGGELILNRNVLTEIYGDEKADELINWAKEAKIKIDDEGVVFSEEKVQIILDENNWTKGPINATLIYNGGDIPKGYEIQYMTNRQTKWVSADKISNITKNCKITARIYNKNTYDEMGLNTKEITKIDLIAPTIESVTGNDVQYTNSNITLKINGAKDKGVGLHEAPYSFDNGATWQASNTRQYSENTSNIIIKVRDKLENIYTYETAIDINSIDKNPPIIESVTGNPNDWINSDVTLTINGAKDNESGLHKEPYSFDNGVTWQGSNTKTYIQNTSNIIIKVRDSVGNEYTHPVINITKIDKKAPSKPSGISVTSGINTLDVKAYGSVDNESGVVGYQYKMGEKGEWSDTILPENTYTFSGLKSATNVTIYARAVDKVGNISSEEDNISNVNTSTSMINGKVSITTEYISGIARYNDWTKKINVRFYHASIPSGYALQYKLSSGNPTTFTTISNNSVISLDYNCKVDARLYNQALDDEVAIVSKDINIIDNEVPTKPTSLSLESQEDTILIVSAAGSTDIGSGLQRYEYSINNSKYWETGKFNLIPGTTYTFYVRAVDNLGNVSEVYTDKFRTLYQYSVTYDANTTDAVSNMPSAQTKVEGKTLTLSSNIPERTGYKFGGWATTANGAKVYDQGSNYTSNSSIKLYAIWTLENYTLTFNADGGTVNTTSISQNYGTTITLPTPTREKYRFLGWYTATSDGTQVTYTTMPAENQTLYAKWGDLITKTLYYRVTRVVSTGSEKPTVSESGSYGISGIFSISSNNVHSNETSTISITIFDVPSGVKIVSTAQGGYNSESAGAGAYYPAAYATMNGNEFGYIGATGGSTECGPSGCTQNTRTIETPSAGDLELFADFSVKGSASHAGSVIITTMYDDTYKYILVEQ